jgi:aminomethyltransferase
MSAAVGNEPRKTPLYDAHKRLGAKLIDFGGWWLPVNYAAGILDEHHATRRAVGVFDVSHMGEIHFRGARAREAVQRLVTNDLGKLTDGRALYTVACLPSGGIVDDLIVYRVRDDHYLIVVNASNTAKDEAHFRAFTGDLCTIENASDETALIAFQGPRAAERGALRPFSFVADTTVAGRGATIARTGYTGEDGFEIFCAPADAEVVFGALVEAANAAGGLPVGLGARDTLRLEARLPLYGNDLTEETTPLEAGLGWVVKLDGADFVGREALRAQAAAGVTRKLSGFVMKERGVARHGYPVLANGQRVGEVTSGSVGPTVGKNIGLAYLPTALAAAGSSIVVDCRGKPAAAEVVAGPFYKRPKP